MTTQPRWPPFAEYEDGEVVEELQVEVTCSYTDEATRAKLLSSLPTWATDVASLKQIYTRMIELGALKYRERDRAAYIASHRPADRIAAVGVHVDKTFRCTDRVGVG